MKIELRRLREIDLLQLTSIVNEDIANAAYLQWPFTKEVATQFIKDYNTWGIWLNETILVGAVEVKGTLETAYLVSKHYHNNGIATKAVQMCRELFADSQLWCIVNPKNKASIRVAQKAGLRIKFIGS